MISPFIGMDPFLEGYLWPDVHHSLASVIKELLVPQIRPKYVARVELYIVKDTEAREDVGIMYPDVEVLQRQDRLEEPSVAYANELPPPTPVSIRLPKNSIVEVRIPVVEIRDRKNNNLITAIEILSPVNKRKPGLTPYKNKREALFASGIHLLEIDFLRRGTRAIRHHLLPKSHYLVSLTRANANVTDAWAFNVDQPLPNVPVPLIKGDQDAILDLKRAMNLIYERSDYGLSIDYQETPPPPVFSSEFQDILKKVVARINK